MKTPETRLLLEIVRRIHENLPLNRRLGLEVVSLSSGEAVFRFSATEELRGHSVLGALDEGIVSAVLDATGNLAASALAVSRMEAISYDAIERQITELGTVEMHIDRRSPAEGSEFLSLGTAMQAEEGTAVIRLELRNEDGIVVAEGTAIYVLE